MRWTAHGWTVYLIGRLFMNPSTSVHLVEIFIVRNRPWSGRSIDKNPSTRPPKDYNLGLPSDSVHEVDGP